MITSFYGGVRFLGVAGGPPLFGLASDYGSRVVFEGGAILALVAGGLVYLLVNGRVLLQPNDGGGKKQKAVFPKGSGGPKVKA